MALERVFGAEEIETILCRLKGIVAASVVSEDDGGIAEIHILAGSTRSPKQIVRDVESALMARLGLAIDHKKISVAQIEDGNDQYDHSRLKFSDVAISLNGSRTEATVRLAKDGAIYSGTSNGTSAASSQLKLIASATIKAIEEFGVFEGNILLEDVNEFSVGGKRVAVVVLSMVSERGEDPLCGSAIIRQDTWRGVVNATLDAVNRRLCQYQMK